MKKILSQYADYNLWANQRIAEAVLKLKEEQFQQEMNSSFPGIRATILHMWIAESAWWQRMKLIENPVIPGMDFAGNAEELCRSWLAQSAQWNDWVSLATEAALAHEFIYRNNKKEQFKQPGCDVLMHVFNHGTYHRGQLVTMLRQLGASNIPGTDFVLYCRRR